MTNKACIFNIQRYSLHDGGGIRTIVFFKGCPFRCPWCCNPESLSTKPQLLYRENLCMHCSKKENGTCETDSSNCPTGAKEIVGEYRSVDEVLAIIKRDYTFYEASQGGVTLSGGECFAQQSFALALLKTCKANNIHTAIETTLALPIENITAFEKYCDAFLVDFKIMDDKKSKEILGIDVAIRDQNVQSLIQTGCTIIPRIPLIPTYTTTKENIDAMITHLKKLNLKEVHLLPFHQLGESKYKSTNREYQCHALTPLSEEAIKDIEKQFHSNGFKTILYGK